MWFVPLGLAHSLSKGCLLYLLLYIRGTATIDVHKSLALLFFFFFNNW